MNRFPNAKKVVEILKSVLGEVESGLSKPEAIMAAAGDGMSIQDADFMILCRSQARARKCGPAWPRARMLLGGALR